MIYPRQGPSVFRERYMRGARCALVDERLRCWEGVFGTLINWRDAAADRTLPVAGRLSAAG
jgi:hypothetical protein